MKQHPKFQSVLLDGQRYILAEDRPLSKEASQLLIDIMNIVGAEAHYDPENESTRKFSARIYPKLDRLNQILGFRK